MTQFTSTRRKFIQSAALGAASLAAPRLGLAAERKPNVLFIPVDDLRPQLGCYGVEQIHSPNIDRLASEGVLFENTFCNVPVCGASRASLMTGIRPTRDRFVGFDTRAEVDLPGCLTLPHHFLNNGYYTLSNGKVFHHQDDCASSWSEPAWRPKGAWRNYVTEEDVRLMNEQGNGRGPAYENADVDDGAYFDGQIAQKTIGDLRRMAKQDKPFFIASGFLKPHLPFNAPKKYWDLYDRDAIIMADNPFRPKDAPDAAMHNWGELRQYYGIPQEGPLDDDTARTLVHGYYACVSYTDAMIGRLLDELDALGLRENTVVILWGDHGWNLREHGLWCKHCNFETSLHAPMLVSAPGQRGGVRTRALTEYVDIYPSLCELCGLDAPNPLHGRSFVPLMSDPDREWKEAVYSRYVRGESVRTKRFLYTEWLNNKGAITARMLYDHRTDPKENVNIAARPENTKLVARLSRMLAENRKQAEEV
ncbi:MAG: sulfatase-like hydrolase/transferase [bacterium]|nr:sulfatase-like hydrolase/transferase [bacterium]